MATQLIREWTGIQQFPPATQSKLFELLGKLKQEVWSFIFTFYLVPLVAEYSILYR